MKTASDSLGPWALASVQALNRNGSWTGRVHVHKHLFISQVLGTCNPPAEFVFYDYGPYSFELDREIVELELFGYLRRSYPKAGYGPSYETTSPLRVTAPLGQDDRRRLDLVAKELGDKASPELELIASCFWAKFKENCQGDKEIIEWVRQHKPRYDAAEIERRLAQAEQIARTLSNLR